MRIPASISALSGGFPEFPTGFMSRFAIICGLLLCADTAMALFGSTSKAPLFFIPMMLGIPILFFGVVALNPHRRRQALATAAGLGAIGFLVGLGHLSHLAKFWREGIGVNPHSVRIVSVMMVICAVFLGCYTWSTLRRARRRVASESASRQDTAVSG